MTCVRCGDVKRWHCRADGSNIRNAFCGGFLEKWPAEAAPAKDEESAKAAPQPVPLVSHEEHED